MTLAYNARSKAEVDAVLAEAWRRGATILKPAEEVFWGGYSGYFADPDGTSGRSPGIPGWSLDEQGRVSLLP